MKTSGGDKLGMLLLEGEIRVHHDVRNGLLARLSVQDRVGWHGYALTQMVGHIASAFEGVPHPLDPGGTGVHRTRREAVGDAREGL